MPEPGIRRIKCRTCPAFFCFDKNTPTRVFCSAGCRENWYSYKSKTKQERRCIACNETFEAANNKKYCSVPCRKKDYEKKYQEGVAKWRAKKGQPKVNCGICQNIFQPKQSNHKYCSEQCSAAALINSVHTQKIGRQRWEETKKTIPPGRYVYGWYFPNEQFPFYVGQGYGSRAWDKHDIGSKGGLAFCERLRTSTTKVVIYRRNLTLEGALLVESVLIDLFRGLGVILANQSEPMKRKEVPPLEL